MCECIGVCVCVCVCKRMTKREVGGRKKKVDT